MLLDILTCNSLQTLTDDIQKYALTLVDKTKELNQEKRRTDSLLYQMLPKPVAERLKYNRDVKAEYFNEVTVSFCDIVGFCRMTCEYSPGNIIIYVLIVNDYYIIDDLKARNITECGRKKQNDAEVIAIFCFR